MNWSKEWGVDPIETVFGPLQVEGHRFVGVDYVSAPDRTVVSFQDGKTVKNYEVIIVGDLGLCYDDPDGWCIYHMPTLTNFNKAVPTYIKPITGVDVISSDYEQSELLEWMKKVQEPFGNSEDLKIVVTTAWNQLNELTPDIYQDKVFDECKNIIKNWCLSVPVKS